MPAGTMLDVLGVLHSIGDYTTITLKNGTEQSKRSIVLRDNSNRSIELTMWAEFASEPGDQLAQVRTSAKSFSGPQLFPLLEYTCGAQWYLIVVCCSVILSLEHRAVYSITSLPGIK